MSYWLVRMTQMYISNKERFITFEGIDGCGKSTQVESLIERLNNNEIATCFVREPGGTPVSEKLRKIILDKKQHISTTEEILLLMSSRLNHIDNVIKPALKNGKIVITDRFADSTFVYQGFVNDFGLKKPTFNKSIELRKLAEQQAKKRIRNINLIKFVISIII